MFMNWLRLIFNSFVFRFLFSLLWTSFALMALDPGKAITQYSMRIWDIEGGLPGNAVYAIQQTKDGYLWIGGENGLVRFDGIHFELYNKRKIPQLKDNVIRALYEDQNGNLWIGTSSGGLTRYKGGEFFTYPITEHRTLYGISAINEDRWGNLWIGSFTRGLTCLSKGKFITYTTKQGLPHNQVKSIYKDGNGDLWVAAAAGIVKMLKPGTFQIYASQDVLPHLKTVCLYEIDTKTLWIGTGEGGLFRMKNGMVTAFGTEAGEPYPSITHLFEDRMKNLWIGTDGGGLTRMTWMARKTQLKQMRNEVLSTLSDGEGLADGSVYSIYEDREGSLWVGTLEGGLHQLRDNKFTTYTTREGLVHDDVVCIYEGQDGDLWIGTRGGLNQLSNGTLTTLLTTKQGLLNNSVLCLFEDREGYLWIGTWGGGVYKYRFKNERLTRFLTKKHGCSDNRIWCILGDRKGNIWIGTENGLNRLTFNNNNNKGKFTITVLTTEDGLLSNFIQFIFEDSRGNLWIGTDAGLNFLKDGVITVYTPTVRIENNYFRCAYEDNEGVLWFGTNSGLIRVKGKGITQTTLDTLYTIECGLVDNYVYSILEDERGYLWLGGRNGISRIKKKELEDFSKGLIDQVRPDSYNEKDGMKARWCNDAGCKTRDGRFWFPTSKGITMIDPNHIKKNILPPSLIIEKLIVDGESININTKTKEKQPVELDPGKKRVEIYYTAVSFINPQKIKFKSMLKGYDRDWVNMGNARSTTYTGLSPGHYTFKMMACNADGVWNEKEASFSFYLKPYFTQTPWFYLSVALFILLVAFSLYRFRVRQLRARGKKLGALVELRTRDLKERNIELENAQQKIRHSKDLIEAKNLQLESQTGQLKEQAEKLKEMDKVKSRFFANISHEFRTPLTLIMGPLEQMLSTSRDKQHQKRLNLMLRNSQRLLGLINQLLELSKFESGKMKLQACQQNIIPFLKGIVASFDPVASKNDLDLTFHTDNETENITLYFDPEKLEEAIFNLLSNAVKFTPPGGRITITVTRGSVEEENFPSGSVDISVCDTGPGIPRDQLAHIFDRFYQSDSTYEHHLKGSGIGLSITKEIVELHHGRIDVHSSEGEGTEFIIQLPMGKAHLKSDEIVEPDVLAHDKGVPSDIKTEVASDYEIDADADVDTSKSEIDFDPLKPGQDIILVVEDNADVRDYIRSSLEPLYTVVDATGGQEGIQKAQEIIPDLIISDIMMPEVDGYELCRQLKNDIKTSHIPIILLTAKASEESIIQGLETGADDYITKPFNTKMLCARIKNLIDLRRHMQETINREMTLQPVKMSVSQIDKMFVKKLKEVINKNISDPEFNIDQLCKKMDMSQPTVYRKIHALTGESPTEFIRSYRLKRGAELLKSNFGTVLEVALEVGFSSANYFTKCFKKKFHQLPSTYQETE
jgi:signal transduction histidine kinase/ligand-binding sensor domain-containing protein/DNA-binding response OmpR family regulator